MVSATLLLIFSALFFFDTSLVSGQITDLDANDQTNFLIQVSPWVANGLYDGITKWSFCSNLYLLGGYNILNPSGTFTRSYSGLPTPHTMILFSMTVQTIDTWDGAPDWFEVKLDGTTFESFRFPYPSSGSNICGMPHIPERNPLQFIINMAHNSASLGVVVTSRMTEGPGDESFGFRDIKITAYTPTTTVANSGCWIGDYTLESGASVCPCPTIPVTTTTPSGYFQNPSNSGQCYPCSATCTTCTSASTSACQACVPGWYLSVSTCFQCNTNCLTCTGGTTTSCVTCETGKFLGMNNACMPTCNAPLVQSSVSTSTGYVEKCTSLCYAAGTYLYWDGSCQATCASPLTPFNPINVFQPYKLCSYTCQIYEFMYWDQIPSATYCDQKCDWPLVQRTTNSRQFCDFPCTNQNDYLYWDGTCHSTCNFPLSPRLTLSRNFCDYPCTPDKYLYFNQSCLAACELPFKVVIDGSAIYCNFPCSDTQVAYWDGSCSSSCPAPRTLVSEGSPLVRYYCTFQCKIDEFLYWNGLCSDACPPPLKYQYEKGKSLCLYPCSSTQYLLYDGTCNNSCNSPLNIRIDQDVKFCETSCPSLQYLYWNGTCADTCDAPLLKRVTATAQFCDFPCSNPAHFLYWDGTCSATCPLPYAPRPEGGSSFQRMYCEYRCNSDQYLYFNRSCKETCSTPFSPRVQNGLKYCDYTCTGVSPSIYLYWDGTCLPTCNSPLLITTDGTADFCEFPCDSQSQFLYWNGTCSDFCMSPLSQVTQGTGDYIRKFCNFGCNSGEYLYWDGSCQTTCDDPFIPKTEGSKQYCLAPCDSVFEYYYPESETCKKGCEAPYSIDTSNNYQRCLSPNFVEEGWFYKNILTPPSGEGKVSLITAGKLTPHISYLDIKMPPRLQNFVASKGRNLFDLRFGSQMSNSMKEDFSNYPIPAPFEQQGLSSNFIVNFWKDFSSFYIAILIAIGLTICEKASKILNWVTLNACFERLRNIARWNLLLILLTTSIGDIILYSALHFRSFTVSDTIDETILGVLVAAVFIIGAIGLVWGSIWLVKKAKTAQSMTVKERSEEEAMNFIKTWQNYQIAFRGFKKDGRLTKYFYAIYIVRLALPKLITAAFYGLPVLVQPVLQLIVSVLITGYILFMQPLAKRINWAQLFIVETLTLAMNICILVLAIFDMVGVEITSGSAVFLGDFIIAGNFFVNLVLIIFLVFKLMNGINLLWTKSKLQKTHDIAQWLQLLALPVQQAGMGFEEMMDFDPRYDDFTVNSTSETKVTELGKFRKNKQRVLDNTSGSISERGLLRNDAQDTKRENSMSTLTYFENRFEDVTSAKDKNPFQRVDTDIKKNPNAFASPEFGHARPGQANPEQMSLDVEDLSPLKNFAGAPQAKFKKFPKQDL